MEVTIKIQLTIDGKFYAMGPWLVVLLVGSGPGGELS